MKGRNVLVMLALLALTTLVWWLMSAGGGGGPLAPATALGAFDKRDVSRINVQTVAKDALTVRRAEGRSDRFEVLVGGAYVRADDVAVDELLSALQRADVSRYFAAAEISPENRAEYGLANPEIVVVLQLPGDDLRTLRLGRVTREQTRMYADRGPDTDVYVIPTDAFEQLRSAIAEGIRDKRITDVANYDVKSLEIVKGGVTRVEAEKDLSQVWHVRQPYKGFAEPQKFEEVVNDIVNARYEGVAEDETQTPAAYGFNPPRYEVILRTKRDEVRTFLIGKDAPRPGCVFVMEKDYPSVLVAPKRFFDAVTRDPQEYRDRSFTRLGWDGTAVTARLGDGPRTYRIAQAGTVWEVERPPPRAPADGTRCEEVMRAIREWHTAAFHDDIRPEEVGISEDGPQVVIDTKGGGKLTLLFGNRLENGNVFAQRKGDGGVEEVLGGPLDLLADGWLQFRTRRTRDLNEDEIEKLSVEPGWSDDGREVERTSVARDLSAEKPIWRNVGPGTTHRIDPAAINSLMRLVKALDCAEWFFFDAGNADQKKTMGFAEDSGKGATVTVFVELTERNGPQTFGPAQHLLVGNPVDDEKTAYFARWKGDGHWPWAFTLPADVVQLLMKPLTRPPEEEKPK